MPGAMDDLNLAEYVRKRWPPVKIIVTSGYVRVTQDSLPSGVFFLPKPYDLLNAAASNQTDDRDQNGLAFSPSQPSVTPKHIAPKFTFDSF
jgi:hypothetical protein